MRRSLAAFSVWPLLLVLLTFTASLGGERPKIIVGGDHENPPYEFLKDGKPTGFNVDLMRAVAEAEGVTVEFRLGPWNDVRRELEQGKIDALAGMYYSEERSKAVDFSVPHTMVTAGLFIRGDSPIRSIDDMKGKGVIVQKGDLIDDYLRKEGIASRIIEVKDPADVLRLLASGRHDCALMPSRFQGEYLIRSLGISNVKGMSTNLPQFRYCFAVRNGNAPLKYRLDEGLNILTVNGKYKEIYDKWFGVYEQRRLWRTVRYFVWALAVIAGLLVASSIWSWILRREVRKRTAELCKSEEDLRHAYDDLEKRVEERTAELSRAKDLLEEEISVRNRTESVITARLRLLEFAATHSLDDLLEATIDEAEALTGSRIGFFVFLEADQKTLVLQNWSTRTKAEFCKAEGKGLHYDLAAAGVWADCIRERRPVIHNDYDSLPHRKGMPPDHAQVFRELVLPVFRGDTIVAIIGVGNKPHDYTSEDIEAVSFLADFAWDITERKEAEEALHLSQFCIDKAGIGIYQSDALGTISSVNEHACKSLGYSREELCALSVFDIDPEITREKMLELKEILDERRTTTFLTTHRRRDGTTFPVEITANHLDFHGKRYGISFVKDITERREAEESLKRAKEEWERTFASVPDLIAILDDQYRVLRVNKAMAKRLGVKPEECVGLHCYEAIHGVSDPPPFCPHTLTLMDGRKHVVEVHEERLGGDFLVSTIPLNDERGVMIGSVHIAYDITERKRAEEALRESEQRYRTVADYTYDWEYWIAPDGSFNYVSPSCKRISGYSAEEFIANPGILITIIHPEDRPKFERHLQDLSNGEVSPGSHEEDFRIILRDGSVRWIAHDCQQAFAADGRYLGRRASNRDITERKRAEEALRESESAVRQKLESILDPEGDTGDLDLADIIDAPEIQALMDDHYSNTGLKMSIIDLKGRVLVDVGWQDICLKFHRIHPETRERCRESDTILTEGVPRGEFKTYRCRNNMWHLVTPIFVGGRHMGNLFMGQFFFENEELDYDLFRAQARQYGFPEEEYIAALEAVPRHSEERVNKGKAFFLRLIDMFSKLSYGNIKLAHSLAERDRLTETLRQANMVVENSPVVLFRCKAAPGWPVELVSKNVVQFGYTPEEFLSGELTYSSIVYPRDLGKLTAETEEYSATGKGKWLQEYRIVTKEGDIRWISDETVCERNEEGEITHYEGVIIDVTERRKAEEQLILQQMQLREVNSTLEERVREEVTKNREKDIMLIQQNRQAALGEMFDHIAHQWKQPLNSIAVIIQALGSTCAYEQVTSEYIVETVDSIMDMVRHMAQTIDVFRNFYRPDKGKSVFLVKDSIDKALTFVTPVLWRHGIEVDVDAEPELSAFGYPKEYAQVLLNLLGNAKDALIERRIKDPRINIKAFADGEYAVVTIADNAGGVPDTNIEHIFDLYFTTKESSGGTGIGLYMSKNIIEKNMGGKLNVSNINDGAQFSIELGKS